ATAPPASRARASGNGPSITTRKAVWRRPWQAPRCTTGPDIRWVMLVDSNDLLLAGLLLLAAMSIGAVVYLLVNPFLSGERRADKRSEGGEEGEAARRVTQVERAA